MSTWYTVRSGQHQIMQTDVSSIVSLCSVYYLVPESMLPVYIINIISQEENASFIEHVDDH